MPDFTSPTAGAYFRSSYFRGPLGPGHSPEIDTTPQDETTTASNESNTPGADPGLVAEIPADPGLVEVEGAAEAPPRKLMVE
jgi:hypothetical protein